MVVLTETRPEIVAPEVTTRDVLHRAADLLEEFGWCQGSFQKNGRYCQAGALARARMDFGLRRYEDWVGVAPEEIILLQELCPERLVFWNDAPERTREDVVANLRELAERA